MTSSSQLVRHTTIASILALTLLPSVRADQCYTWYRGYYDCNNGISGGARLGVGIGIAAGVLLLSLGLSLCIRKRRLARFKAQSQTLPTTTTQSYPANYQPQHTSSYYTAQYQPPVGAPPSKPPQAYQPSSAYQYGGNGVHGYEYQQAEENRRMEEAGGLANELPPPTYDTVANNKPAQNSYQPPSGPPPRGAVV